MTSETPTIGRPAAADEAAARYRRQREAHWDDVARRLAHWKSWGGYYQRRLTELYRLLVPPGLRVLEIGCGEGDLLAALDPSVGVGVDFSAQMIRRAEQRHPRLRWVVADAHELQLNDTFDAIILSDLVNDLWDVQTALGQVLMHCTPRTRILINTYSRVWEPLLSAAAAAGLCKPSLPQNWLTVEDLSGLLRLAHAQVIRCSAEILCPLPVPGVHALANRYLVKLWPFRLFALTSIIVAKPAPRLPGREARVSVIVPARNEAGNVERVVRETPEMGLGTDIVFVEGHSRDDTVGAIERAMASRPDRRCRLLRQRGVGKGDAVRLGFEEASGDILMILDADLTVPPADLPRFYEALRDGTGEFANGVRLVYPMERQAMRFLNLAGNKAFSLAFSWLLGQPVKDTLCGTKALWRADYERIARNRSYFGDFDPFGDFDLLFGAAKSTLQFVEIPIRYRERTYGQTNIERWRHGWLLLKMVVFAARRIKFI